MPNAIEMLCADHRNMKKLFEEFDRAGEARIKKQIIETTIRELKMHGILEEEIFYTAVEKHIDDRELIDIAREEHQLFQLLMTGLKKVSGGGKRYNAKYKVLSDNVKNHIEAEESELFPKIEGRIDAEELGARMEIRKTELFQRNPRKRAAVGRSRRAGKAVQKGSAKSRKQRLAGRR